MTQRYVTHLGTVFFVHFFLLWGGVQIFKQEMPGLHTLQSSIVNVRLASEVLSAQAKPERKKVERSTQKVAQEAPAPLTQEASPASSPSVNSKATASLKAIYKAELRAKIEENKTYPLMSRRMGQTGTVIVAFTLLEDGHIIDVKLDEPSQFDRLNESAMEAVKRVGRFKPIPKEFGESKMSFRVPVKFVTI